MFRQFKYHKYSRVFGELNQVFILPLKAFSVVVPWDLIKTEFNLRCLYLFLFFNKISSKKLCVLFFSVVLLMVVPVSVDGAFTNNSCMKENGKAKMIKNSNENKKIYCVSLKTAEILEDRGWGINLGDNDYFLYGVSFRELQGPNGSSSTGNSGPEIKIIDFENEKEKFYEWEQGCKVSVFSEKRDDGSIFEFVCELRYYNDTWVRMISENSEYYEEYGPWVTFVKYFELFY